MIFDVTDVRGTATEILNIKPTNRIKEVANKSVIDKENNIVHIDVEFKLAEPFYYREKEIIIFDIDDGSSNNLIPSYDDRTQIRLYTANSRNREFLRAVYHQELSMIRWHMYLTPGTISDETDLDMVWHIKDSFIINKNYNFIDTNVELLKRYNELSVFGNNSGTINLFDVNSSRSEKNLSIQEGGEYNASGFTISDYIDVEEDTEYVTYTEYGMSGSTSACICWYKANGQYISGEYLNGTHYNYGLHSPAGAKKCRFSMLTSEKNKMNFIKELDWLNNDRKTVEWLPSIKQLKTSLNDITTPKVFNISNSSKLVIYGNVVSIIIIDRIVASPEGTLIGNVPIGYRPAIAPVLQGAFNNTTAFLQLNKDGNFYAVGSGEFRGVLTYIAY